MASSAAGLRSRATSSAQSSAAWTMLPNSCGRVGADPPRVERVRRAASLERLAHLPVDPVARQEGGEGLVEGRPVGHREEIARVRDVGRRERGGGDALGGEAEFGEEALVQRPLHPESSRRVVVEHDDPLVAGGAGGGEGQGARELTQVERVLHRVELKARARQRAVGEPRHERVAEDGGVDGLDGGPEVSREAHALEHTTTPRYDGVGRR